MDSRQVMDYLVADDGKNYTPLSRSWVPDGGATFDTSGFIDRHSPSGVSFYFPETPDPRWGGNSFRPQQARLTDTPVFLVCYDPNFRDSFDEAKEAAEAFAFSRAEVRTVDIIHQESWGRHKFGDKKKVGERTVNDSSFLCILAAVRQALPLVHYGKSGVDTAHPTVSQENKRVTREEGERLAAAVRARHEGKCSSVWVEIDLTTPQVPYEGRRHNGYRDGHVEGVEPPPGIRTTRKLMAEFGLKHADEVEMKKKVPTNVLLTPSNRVGGVKLPAGSGAKVSKRNQNGCAWSCVIS